MWWNRKPKRIYLDYAAATPVRPEVFKVMRPFFMADFGNAGAIYKEGVKAKKAIMAAREEVARALAVKPENVTFTGSGTESNNLAIWGLVRAMKNANVPYSEMEIISTAVEHPSVKKVLEEVAKLGVLVLEAPIDSDGLVIKAEFKKLLSAKTRLVTIAYANSETGVVQDINNLGRVVKDFERANDIPIAFHTDASQAPLWLPCQLEALSVDLLTLDAGKCYGPKGLGVLVHRKSVSLKSVLQGGSQESGLRPSTENVAAIVGGARAIVLAQQQWKKRAEKVAPLRDQLMNLLLEIPNVVINGSKTSRLANNVNVSLMDVDTEYLVIALDAKGVAVATKSACSGADGSGSSVVYALSEDTKRANSTLRLTLGETTTTKDLLVAVTAIRDHLDLMNFKATNT
jgi:cysteine desulfurase